jgi:hypothetical protein
MAEFFYNAQVSELQETHQPALELRIFIYLWLSKGIKHAKFGGN